MTHTDCTSARREQHQSRTRSSKKEWQPVHENPVGAPTPPSSWHDAASRDLLQFPSISFRACVLPSGQDTDTETTTTSGGGGVLFFTEPHRRAERSCRTAVCVAMPLLRALHCTQEEGGGREGGKEGGVDVGFSGHQVRCAEFVVLRWKQWAAIMMSQGQSAVSYDMIVLLLLWSRVI